MNILFLSKSISELEHSLEYNEKLIRGLTNKKNVVGLYSKDKNDYMAFNHISELIQISETEFEQKKWDIIIIQNSGTYCCFEEELNKSRTPAIFISHSSKAKDRNVITKNLYGVINVYEDIRNSNWGIPDELIKTISYPININYKEYHPEIEKKQHVVIFHDESTQFIDSLRDILIAFNLDKYLRYSVSIICSAETFAQVNKINNNIKYINEKQDPMLHIQEADIVIGAGLPVYQAIMAGKPVIVSGIRGFGGFITPENIKNLKKNNFTGRAGAELMEIIPPKLLGEELSSIYKYDIKILKQTLKNNREILEEECSASIIINNIIMLLNEAILLNRRIYNDEEILQLNPKLASDIRLRTNKRNDLCFLTKYQLNKDIIQAHAEIMGILNELDGTRNIKELLDNKSIYEARTRKSFIEMIRRLWEEKAVVFK